MLLTEIRSQRDRIDFQFKLIEGQQDQIDIRLLGLAANQMALRCAGLVERSVQLILAEYARLRSTPEIARYVQRNAEWENSLNCEKIERLLERFDPKWWPSIKSKVNEEARSGVDSLKTIRDQLAHGGDNGTGLTSTKKYHQGSCRLIDELHNVLLPD